MKTSLKTTPWHEVYKKLALELQRFYKKHRNLSGQELFKLLNQSKIYRANNSWLSNINRIKTPSLDPIQLFVSFNRSRQVEDDRIQIINEVWTLLTTKKRNWDDINFEGCPSPMALKLQYIRPEPVQIQIWEAFNDIMERGKGALSVSLWDNVKNWRGLQIPSLTIFLFWIKSKEFLPLDKNTRRYLEYTGLLLSNAHLTFDLYQSLLSNKQISDYIQLSIEAYYFNLLPDVFEERFQKKSLARNKEVKPTNFKLVGLRTLGRNRAMHKVLLPHQYYPIDHTIKPEEKPIQKRSALQQFHQNPSYAETLYKVGDLNVNISAIVGKNGSGKSTLLDLILMGIYNLSIQLGYLNRNKYESLENLNFELYWHTDTLYKIVFGERISVYQYKQNNSEGGTILYELNKRAVSPKNYKIHLFYSILINYSHYALNSSEQVLDWITPLSHKNDGYLTPLVINPKRTNGSIDINNEKSLLNMRLLLNLLELHDADIPKQSFRYIDNGKYLKYFALTPDSIKNRSVKEDVEERTYNDPKIVPLVMEQVFHMFDLKKNLLVNLPYRNELNNYIVNKLLTIIERYEPYTAKYNEEINRLIEHNIASTVEGMDLEFELALQNRIKDLLDDVKTDNSHITLKFKQAIYYLKYPSLQKILSNVIKKPGTGIELDEYYRVILEIINSGQEDNLKEAQLLPPAIFKLDFLLDDSDKSSFSKASSGEYQLISVLSSILYHIRNIDSIGEENRYNYVTVLLDEIELYFHPNMQRFFIKKLCTALSKLDNELYGLHILFATHSPFILSDLQQQKILKLKNGTIERSQNQYNTFAANIHDLLADEFFLDEGYMGAFAQNEIEIAINLLNYIIASNDITNLPRTTKGWHAKERKLLLQKLNKEIDLYKEMLKKLDYWNDNRKIENFDTKSVQQYLFERIEIIGEPLIKEKLGSMYRNAFPNDSESVEGNRDNAKEAILQMMQQHNFKLEDLQ